MLASRAERYVPRNPNSSAEENCLIEAKRLAGVLTRLGRALAAAAAAAAAAATARLLLAPAFEQTLHALAMPMPFVLFA